jgi:hypothetical protein
MRPNQEVRWMMGFKDGEEDRDTTGMSSEVVKPKYRHVPI